jgi:hypothetical protein
MTEPLKLSDLKRKTALHKLNGSGQTIELVGLTAKDYCTILDRFQSVGLLTLGGRANIFDAIKEVPEALAAWDAAACGEAGNPEAEKHILDNLTVDDAMSIAEASMPLTFVNGGFGPFYERQMAVLAHLFPTNRGKEQATTSPTPSPPAEDQQTPAFGS